MDNNLENECGKNDLCFKGYETNKINYPLKVDNYSSNAHSNIYLNNYFNEKDNDSMLIHKEKVEIGRNLLNFEKKRLSNKNNQSNNGPLHIDNLMANQPEDSYVMKCRNFERKKEEKEKSSRLTSSNNSASGNNNQANSKKGEMKSSVKHVLEYVNKGLQMTGNTYLSTHNNQKSLKSTKNQDFNHKIGYSKKDHMNDINAYYPSNNENDMKYNAPKRDLLLNNNQKRDLSKDSKDNAIKEAVTPKIDKYATSLKANNYQQMKGINKENNNLKMKSQKNNK